ncbi:MmcQ/YjbR family DNA-binding protein [Reinekea marina]|uniref:MmcQ/YjbR family DNA-binding protein n=1 Tax=Reinekea marina TaxID=1310421 RepID=A0ABV7WQS6_9GAMM|nr:MmcQ/YjbR family DNA-binding protein [Reinekea marina]MDN3650608.1 MmcQ/YjbR family DNA-binding protein [Reinekea marina]
MVSIGELHDQWRSHCLTKQGASEDTPFGPEALVFKVEGKMFALLMKRKQGLALNLKCDPQEALIIRESFEAVIPGYHMNKKHWNTVYLDQGLDESLIAGWIADSYNLVVQSLPKKTRIKYLGDN